MKNIFTVFVLILLLSYVELSAQGGKKPPGGPPPPPTSGNPPPGGGQGPSFDDVDSNHDGKISLDEAKAEFGKDPNWQAEFKQRDKNKDGYVDKDEFFADMGTGGQNPPGGYQPPTGNPPGGYQPPTGNPPAGTGGYKPPTGPPPTGTPPAGTGGYKPTTGNPPGGGQGPSFDDVDSNHDGKISLDEAKAKFGNDPNWQAEFKQRDKNDDGYLDKEEFKN